MKKYYPTINMLRGLAALMVCLYHFILYSYGSESLFTTHSTLYNIASLGVNGVFVFFVISGFVIPLSLFKYKFKIKYFHQFLLKRFVRIEIPYFVSILLILSIWFIYSIRLDEPFHIDFKQFVYHIFYLIPFSSYSWYNIIYWTLAIEFQFYIIIGLLYVFFITKNKFISIGTILLLLGVNFVVVNDKLVFYYGTIFLQGIVLFLIQSYQIKKTLGFSIIFVCSIATAYLHSPTIAIFCLATVAVIYFVEINHAITNFFGNISYSLYLTHGAIGLHIIAYFFNSFESYIGKIILVLVGLIASFVFAFFYWKFIENPSKKLAQKVNFSSQKLN